MADENLFWIELVTPERILVSGLASEVILRTGEGDITFLAGSAPLVGSLAPGVIRVVRSEGDGERVAVHGGFVQVEQHVDPDDLDGDAAGLSATGTRITLLVGVAELAGEIDTDRARTALEAAQARVGELTGAGGRVVAEDAAPDADLVEAEGAVLRAEVRLEAADAAAPATA
jgi:F-type H+-transporting ATPase subunit epsilon